MAITGKVNINLRFGRLHNYSSLYIDTELNSELTLLPTDEIYLAFEHVFLSMNESILNLTISQWSFALTLSPRSLLSSP